ncbi:MAG TPA: cyanophycinase [Gammaproteobacteria bacterium]|nr:cyanophycinase [Gammaproteobacteria bacterium]
MCPAPIIDNVDRGWVIPIGGAEDKVDDMTILRRFCQLCGGKKANILVVPTASQLDDTGPRYVELFEGMGATSKYTPINEREDCFNEDIIASLKEASGIFITGGNQLRLSTILGGTPVAKLIRSLNAQGTHVAGTSAGAAIVSEHMIAGGESGPTPTEDGVVMAPGLGLTNKVIIDQHFQQRDRIGRLLAALSYNPFVSGLGIDEDTAAFISPQGVLEVVGSGAITVVDPSELTYSSMAKARHHDAITLIGMKLHILGPGSKYDINTRTAIALINSGTS